MPPEQGRHTEREDQGVHHHQARRIQRISQQGQTQAEQMQAGQSDQGPAQMAGKRETVLEELSHQGPQGGPAEQNGKWE